MAEHESMYAITDVPGRGKGLVATRDIARGTRILEEKPLITTTVYEKNWDLVAKQVSHQVKALNDEQRESFFSLHNIHPYQNQTEQALGIVRTVGLPIEANGISGGIFLNACRINHACDNNAQKHWNQRIERHTVHALRDISKGEEITIFYLGQESSRQVRQKKLKETFGFLCSCRICSLPADKSKAHDKRLARIDVLDTLIAEEAMNRNLSLTTLGYAEEIIRLRAGQGQGIVHMSRPYLDAAQIALINSDLARGRVFAERAVEGWSMTQGIDCEEVISLSSIVRDPSSLQMYGMSSSWSTSLDDIPKTLGEDDFENWLWRRERPVELGRSGTLSHLRNRTIFPHFRQLPSSGSIDTGYYTTRNGLIQPTRSWCFLGEILGHHSIHHLELALQDVSGHRFPLHFNTPSLGREMEQKHLQKGHTVAVLRPQRHVFIYGDPGIRHEDPQKLMIFPVSLHDLLNLSDQLHRYSTATNGTKTCHGCEKQVTASASKKCGRCSCFSYCNEACQRVGWTKGNHKRNCKLLTIPDLRALFFFKWDTAPVSLRFPLPIG